jgi:benzoylformate decarboxylase
MGAAANGADWLCAALVEQGVEVLFGNPGSTELPLTDALGRAARGPRYVLGLHEATVVAMADGYAQATGTLAAVNVHVQPGLANALSGILNAARARVPLLVTVGQQVQEMLPGAPFLGGELVELARPLAKGAWEVRDPQGLPGTLATAVATALEPPRGPVVVSLPLDVQMAAAPARAPRVPVGAPPAPAAGALEAASRLLGEARAPVVLAGDEVARSGASGAVLALARRLGSPLFGEPMAATVPVPSDDPLWRGPLPPFAAEIREVLAPFDLVVAIGMPVFRLFGDSPGPALAPGVRLVHLDVDPDEIGRVHVPAAGLVGGIGAGVEGLLHHLGAAGPDASRRRAAVGAATALARRAARRRVLLGARDTHAGVTPEAFAAGVADALGPRDLLVDESLTSGRSLRALVCRRTPATWLAHRGSALGWGLPAAVGAAIARPDRRVMALQGDGSLMFGIHALWTAAHERVGVALVVADNGGYEILRAGMEGLTGQTEGAWPGLRIDEPRIDLVALCRGFGASAERASTRAELREGLRELWHRARSGPAALVVGVEGRTPPVGYPAPSV